MAVLPTELTPEKKASLKALNLRDGEYFKILNHLGREPNFPELCMFSAMWSEHCSYKHTRHLLRKLPTEGDCILQGPGENAGVIDVGDGLAVAFKVESHNHPTYVEPYQGATTGVGGILRDIITMNARPIALLNALRFGPLENSSLGRTINRKEAGNRYRLTEAVKGIGDYGNCTGVPTVGGDIFFHETYGGNPLVNAMAIGVMQPGGIMASGAKGVGNPVLYVGSATGRDGMGGASFASRSLDETKRTEDRPAVQVGDPFTGKLLLEACLEAFATGLVVSAQDMGAAGLTCATCEMAAKGHMGMSIDLDQVPAREEGMIPFEFLLSESQERFLLVLQKGQEQPVIEVFKKWHIPAVMIGEVIEEERVWIHFRGERVVDLPVKLLTELTPSYNPGMTPEEPDEAKARRRINVRETLPDIAFSDVEGWLQALLQSGNIVLPTDVFHQYDGHVRNSTWASSENNTAGIVQLRSAENKPSGKALASTLDGNPRYVYLEPYTGTMCAVAEAARNLVAVGAKPLAVTNNLNFGDPEAADVYYQLYYSVEGIGDACRALNTPVTGGNVSLYNTHQASAIIPSPVIGMVGLLENNEKPMTAAFKSTGHGVALVGHFQPAIGGSEYQWLRTQKIEGAPPILSLKDEVPLNDWVLSQIQQKHVCSVDDVSLGGVLVSVFEGCALGNLGAILSLNKLRQVFPHCRLDELLFGESQGSFLVTYDQSEEERLRAALLEVQGQQYREGWVFVPIGTVSQDRVLRIEEEGGASVDFPLAPWVEQWKGGVGLQWKTA